MKLLADFHTHSKNSRFKHGKNSIEEMAIEANEKGLVEIGITDHGYNHFFRTNKNKLKEARRIVDDINQWSKTKVLLGLEADIIREDGSLDVDNETLSMLDILIVSYHRMTFTDFANFFGFTKKTEEAKRKCTNAFINAIKKYPVTIVAHLDSILTTDLYEVGRVCRDRGTLVEINNRHTKWNEKQIQDLIDSGCMFVVSSDAHSREKVAEVDKSFDIIRKYNIPSERIVNVEFSEEEKSEDDRRLSVYTSIYEQIEKIKKDKEKIIEQKSRTEITGKLSSEMEDALKTIAQEKGLNYENSQSEVFEEGFVRDLSLQDQDLINEAEEYINSQKIEEMLNESEELEEFEKETFESFEDDHPLLRDSNSFEDRFQSINTSLLVGDDNESQNQEKNVSYETSSNEKILNNDKVITESAYEQLNSGATNIQNLKDIMSSSKSSTNEENENNQNITNQARQVFKKVEPENFMDSITQTKLVNNSKQVESVQPEKKIVASKPKVQKNGRKGAFIAVDNLIDDNK